MYSETCINRSCSKTEILLRRIDTFDPIWFLHASISRISKEETLKRTFFQSSDKKATSLTRTKIKILGISEKQRIKLHIFVSFYTLKQQWFLISFCSFERVRHFWVKLCTFFSQTTNIYFSSLTAIAGRDLQTIFHPSMNYWFQFCNSH